jgi:ArsR family transcriptional regulator, arsenate/arsenite/antimonite-responsive transcriptional repressor
VDDAAPILKAIADPVRLQILDFLRAPVAGCCSRADGVCGCDFEELLGLSQPTVSHHLRLLVDAGLVRAEKRGRWVYYELAPDAFAALIDRLRPFAAAPAASLAR